MLLEERSPGDFDAPQFDVDHRQWQTGDEFDPLHE